MNEEQFVNIDLNDDNICCVCKMETESEMLSFCHLCFELSFEGISRSNLLHVQSLRGHRECFEKCHQIANQDLPRPKVPRSTYRDVKDVLSRKISQIVHYAQNQPQPQSVSAQDCARANLESIPFQHLHPGRTLLAGSQLPRYAPCWPDSAPRGLSECARGILEGEVGCALRFEVLGTSARGFGQWTPEEDEEEEEGEEETESGQRTRRWRREPRTGGTNGKSRQQRHRHRSREDLSACSVDDLVQLNTELLNHIKDVFEELKHELEEKDSLSTERQVRYIAIEQLFKNRSKLPWLRVGSRGVKPNLPLSN